MVSQPFTTRTELLPHYHFKQDIAYAAGGKYYQIDLQEKEEATQSITRITKQNIQILHLLKAFENYKTDELVVSNNNDSDDYGIDININDDGLSPTIPIGASVKIVNSDSYNNGDIVAIKIDEMGG